VFLVNHSSFLNNLGPGTNVWNSVYIHDLANLYIILYEKALKERETGEFDPDPYTRFYFASVGRYVWGELIKALAPILHAHGVVDSDEAVSVDASTLRRAVTTDSQSVSNRGFADGWKPIGPTVYETLEEDVEGVLAQDK